MVRIPMFDVASLTQQVVLDGFPFNLKIVWNTRGEFWTLSIFDTGNTPIVVGIKMVLGFALLTGYKHISTLPPGNIYVSDPTINAARPGRDDFTGDRQLELLYVTEAEIAAI